MSKKVVTLRGSPSFATVSLFSGAMGLDLGLMQAGLNVVVSQDTDKWCAETVRANGHKIVEGDIRQLLHQDPSCSFLLSTGGIKTQDVFAVVGGPPCQAYSTAGKRRGTADERGSLFEQFAQVVGKLRPRFFVMENVKGLLSMPSIEGDKNSEPLLSVILSRLTGLGYHVIYGILDAVHYGTPQFRERLVIIGSRDNEAIFLPAPTHFHLHQSAEMRWATLGSAISDLIDEPGPGSRFSEALTRYLKKFQKAVTGGLFRHRIRRQQWEGRMNLAVERSASIGDCHLLNPHRLLSPAQRKKPLYSAILAVTGPCRSGNTPAYSNSQMTGRFLAAWLNATNKSAMPYLLGWVVRSARC